MADLPQFNVGLLARFTRKTGDNELTMLITRANSTADERGNVQLALWVLGLPTHNSIDNCCVPDWSCCRGEHRLAPQRLRDMFWLSEASRPALAQDWAQDVQENDPGFAIGCDIPGQVVMRLERTKH